MKYNKISAIASWAFTGIPFLSASLPFSEGSTLKVIMIALFIISWLILGYGVLTISGDSWGNQNVNKPSKNKIIGYWIVKYTNQKVSSLFQICDSCGSDTKSFFQDYDENLSATSKKGINHIDFNGDNQLIFAQAVGENKFSFIQFKYLIEGEFDITRLDDNGTSMPVKLTGSCKLVTPTDLIVAGVCILEKDAKKMIKKFNLTESNIRLLLEYKKKGVSSNSNVVPLPISSNDPKNTDPIDEKVNIQVKSIKQGSTANLNLKKVKNDVNAATTSRE